MLRNQYIIIVDLKMNYIYTIVNNNSKNTSVCLFAHYCTKAQIYQPSPSLRSITFWCPVLSFITPHM